MHQQEVIIVGAGPAGLATAACLNLQSIPNIVLEREDCLASLWKKFTYDRLHLHLPKYICELPHMPIPSSYPNYAPKKEFLQYLDDYAEQFNVSPLYQRLVEFSAFDEAQKKWIVKAKNLSSGDIEEFAGRFLVVASGETADPYIPKIEGLETFNGKFCHSTKYKSGKEYKDKKVLVVGSGNSGMEIALDLVNHGADAKIVVRSPVHVMSREMASLGLKMMKCLPFNVVDSTMVLLSRIVYGDMTKYGIRRPEKEGPFLMKVKYGKYPLVDVGTCEKIKSGVIQVLPGITSIKGNEVNFENGQSYSFDNIIFATGFKRSTNKWLKEPGEDILLNENGIPKKDFPNQWKGENGLYCCGLSRRGFLGISHDALHIADDIKKLL